MTLPAKNLLAGETSPYLLQHKDNPVHWRPWSPEALAEAKELERPVLLSIGYAACHWCHVMAHESFEDDGVAAVMNRLFVNIKVDREERPDIDQIYMAALQATGEQGGWPLTMFLTPEAKPFWGGTYFPKTARFGRPGFTQILEAVSTAWQDKRADLQKSADALSSHVQTRLAGESGAATNAGHPPLRALAERIASMTDAEHGGLRGAPKFPNAPFLDVLWLDWLEHGTAAHRDAVLSTLRHMLSGGVYDHVGGGLARYATDERWLVPHFEKMLYDNAQLIRLCCYAHGHTGDPLFRMRIEETVDWLLREMTVQGGAFASSFDADSEGEEGKFYLWTREEIGRVLGDNAETLLETYALASPGGWEGDPILHRLNQPAFQGDDKERELQALLKQLHVARAQRVPPGRDDKVLVDWNGLTIAALATAGRQFARADWVDAAEAAYRFVCESMRDDRLPHSIGADRSQFPGLSADYGAMVSAAVALHGARQNDRFLKQARAWVDALRKWHAAPDRRGHFLTSSDARDVPMRIRGDVDEAVPSATSQVIAALVQLSTATGDHALYEEAVDAAQAALGRALNQPHGQAGIIHACALAERPMKLLIHDDAHSPSFVPVANRIADPRRVDIVLGRVKTAAERAADITIDRSQHGAWLCIGQTCLPPIHDPVLLDSMLRTQHRG